jgi:hypothetical protein
MQYRDMSRDAVVAVEGDVLIGQQAIDAGLADGLGSEEGALARLKQQAAATKRTAAYRTYQEVSTMDWKQVFGGMFAAAAEVEGAPLAAASEQAAPLRTPEQPTPDPRVEQLQAQLATLQREATAARASAWVERVVRENRALPAESAELVAIYTQAATDDATSPLEGMARVARLEAQYAARPPHQLTTELLPDHVALSLDRRPQNDAASLAALRNMTELGRQAQALQAKSV